ncbi:MAG: arginine--tRNA ligase [Oligoflexia bacterium]|nr:arginine--tRNA ligase [Oligoflexia bacterium]
MERFAKLAARALNQVLETPIQPSDLETPPDPKMGDFGFPCFRLAKQFKKGPPQVAQQLVAELKAKNALPQDLTVAAVGPYVNFTVPQDKLLGALLRDLLAGAGLGTYGKLQEGSRGSWVLEYSSPNVAKPLNIYHLRPTALGAALDRIGRFRGFEVFSINHLGDWGKQYGMLSVAFRHFNIPLDQDLSMRELVDLYVRINAEAEKNPALEEEARQDFVKLEKGDPAITAFWQKCVRISLREFDRAYGRLGVRFDHIWGESFYREQLPPLLDALRKKGLLVESEGAQVVPVTDREGHELPPCILQKTDGGTTYATRDVAAALFRQERFRFDRMTYIVGGEQKLHFQQIFAVLKQMGCDWVERCEHVPTGLYRFKDAKMSTRKGNFVTLEEVLELAKERVTELLAKRESATELSPEAAAAITEAVAVGAVVFHDLSTDPARDVEFDVERVVDFEGETGPYLQYAHTRCLSILRKARETGQLTASEDALFDERLVARLQKPEELALVKTLGMLPLHLERTLSFAKASQLANYLIDVTQAFGAFYRECKVLGEEPELTQARLMLVEATRRILARGLSLILIPLPERM